MAGFITENVTADFAANGDTDGIGYVTVSDTTGFVEGATVSIRSLTVAAATFEIVAVDTAASKIGVRSVTVDPLGRLNGQNYGLSSVSAYLTANSAKIIQPSQFIYDAYTS